MLVHGYNPPKDYLFEEAWLMSQPRIKYKRVILVIGRKDICGVSLSLHIARNGSILQFFNNLLDCKRLCLSRPRPMLTQFNHIVSGLQMLLNHDPINVNCVSFVALHQNRRTVWAFWEQNLRAVHPLPFFATPDSHHQFQRLRRGGRILSRSK